MKIVTLIENTAVNDEFYCEHGLSLYIETQGKRILFDTGQTGLFADNAHKLWIDLSRVDFAVLSHGHYDHGGGLRRFMEINASAPIYLNRSAFMPHYNADGRNIGLDEALLESDRFVFVDDYHEICENISLLSCNDKKLFFPLDCAGLSAMDNGTLIPEDFRHEQYLLVQENGRRICFSGCSHKGILNIQRWFCPDVLVGGFHYMKLDHCGSGRQVLLDAAKELMEYPTVYYTGHCTGDAQYTVMKNIMGEQLNRISSGICIHL